MLAPLLFSLTALAAGFDHSHAELAQVLDGAVSPTGVDYGLLATRRGKLQHYLGTLAEAPVASFSRDEQLAFWINAYNAVTIDVMLAEGPPASIMDLDGGKVWDSRKFRVGGEQVSLNDIEHGRVRRLADGRIHAAVNCASKGCPPLPAKPATAGSINAHLDQASRTWAVTNAYRIEGNQLQLSEIFNWYGDDFTQHTGPDIPGVDGKAEHAIHFLVGHLPKDKAAELTSGKLTASWMPYDWTLNRR